MWKSGLSLELNARSLGKEPNLMPAELYPNVQYIYAFKRDFWASCDIYERITPCCWNYQSLHTKCPAVWKELCKRQLHVIFREAFIVSISRHCNEMKIIVTRESIASQRLVILR
jgi:hypothetical protein